MSKDAMISRSAGNMAVQVRSQQTVRNIIAAGIQLLESSGAGALTIAGVANEAKVAVGTVYQRFGTKEQLLAEIQSKFTADFLAEFKDRMMRANLSDCSKPVELVEAAVKGIAETFRTHTKLLRVFILLGTENSAVLEVGAQISKLCGEAFRGLLLRARSEIRRDDVEAAADHAYRIVYATCAHRVVFGTELESDVPTSWRLLQEQLCTMITLFLFADLPGQIT
jgi:AcrR family transcriptional regulator